MYFCYDDGLAFFFLLSNLLNILQKTLKISANMSSNATMRTQALLRASTRSARLSIRPAARRTYASHSQINSATTERPPIKNNYPMFDLL